jgi:hypothetical protein
MNRIAAVKSFLLSAFILLLAMIPSSLWAQGAEMADKFRADGKIYIVIIVIITIFIGIIVYLFSLEKKIKRLERGDK